MAGLSFAFTPQTTIYQYMANTVSNLTAGDPLSYGLSISEAQKYLRDDDPNAVDVVNLLITGSLEAAEDFLGYPITSRSLSGEFATNWTINIAPFYAKNVSIMVGTSSFSDFELENKQNGAYVYLKSLPEVDTVSITFETGEATVPANMKLAMLKYVVDGYEQRSNDVYGASVSKPSFSFANLLHPNKHYTV